MQKKIIFFTTVITLFFAALFLDENRTPVPVKFFFMDPRPIGLSSIIVVSMLVGVLVTFAVLWLYKSVRKSRKNQLLVEKNIE
ncbi:MAG: lipopolysaccharide assembly protein LapA domain-containing protein [Desulfuromonadaceae bacterium]